MTDLLQTTLRPADDVLFQEVSGEVVILDLKSECYFGLDEVGTRIWQLLEEGRNGREIHHQLLQEFEVGTEQLERDLVTHLTELIDKGLLEVAEPT